jgi:hypothetical protein
VKFGTLLLIAALGSLAGCHAKPLRQPSAPAQPVPEVHEEPAPPPPAEDQNAEKTPIPNADEANTIPPCLPEPPKPKIAVKRKTRPSPQAQKPAPEAQLPPVGSSKPEIRPIEASVASILGKKVQSAGGEDLGRVVDVQADSGGRVRLVIIEYGGFLGVGNRRAAIDWGLLRFHPNDPERPLSLTVSTRQVQGTPEYRQASHPQALMAPIPAPVAAPAAAPTPPAAPSPAPAQPPASAPAQPPATSPPATPVPTPTPAPQSTPAPQTK